jgi:hypothetical protein
MKHFLTFAAVLAASLTVGQDVQHAPTIAQCQADQRLWLSKLEGDPSELPKFMDLHQWQVEMLDCRLVDHSNIWLYYNTAGEIASSQQNRLYNFVVRQGLWSKFLAEDAAGKR